ncbi:MAG: DUF6146 family protein, partial [Bacteroidales bacterium]|nr:DUF6146 family protein [Bacteroidales bacterium]
FRSYFDKWYQMNHSAALERDGSFYKNRNYLAVNTWNNYYREGRYPNHVMSYIQYNPAEDYGVEVNRLLYWYFKYMQETYRIRLLH